MITVQFTCEACGLVDVDVKVPARQSPNTDVVAYVERTIGNAVSRRHRRLSPNCPAIRMTNVKIPLAEGEDGWIGKQT